MIATATTTGGGATSRTRSLRGRHAFSQQQLEQSATRRPIQRHYSCNPLLLSSSSPPAESVLLSQRFRKHTRRAAEPCLGKPDHPVLDALAALSKYPHPQQPQLALRHTLDPATSQQTREIAARFKANKSLPTNNRLPVSQILLRRNAPRELPPALAVWADLLANKLARDGANAAALVARKPSPKSDASVRTLSTAAVSRHSCSPRLALDSDNTKTDLTGDGDGDGDTPKTGPDAPDGDQDRDAHTPQTRQDAPRDSAGDGDRDRDTGTSAGDGDRDTAQDERLTKSLDEEDGQMEATSCWERRDGDGTERSDMNCTPLLSGPNFRRQGRVSAQSFTRRPVFRRRTERARRQPPAPADETMSPSPRRAQAAETTWVRHDVPRSTLSGVSSPNSQILAPEDKAFCVKALHPIARVVLKNTNVRPAELLCDIPGNLRVDLRDLQLLPGPISKGSFGTVRRALYHGREVAVKLCHTDQPATVEQLRNFERELNAYHALKHEHILKFIGASVESLDSLALVFDYLPNGNAFELFFENVIQVTAVQRLKIALQLVEVISYLHRCRPVVIHRDIKTPNLVFDREYNVKLCDFGKTKFMHRAFLMLEDNGGSPRYMAPECFVPNGIITEKADIWSLACCLIEVFGGPIPHEDHFDNETVIQVTLFERRSPFVPSWFHPAVRDTLLRCFEWNATRRPSALDIYRTLLLLSPSDLEEHGMDLRRVR